MVSGVRLPDGSPKQKPSKVVYLRLSKGVLFFIITITYPSFNIILYQLKVVNKVVKKRPLN